jgi:hypothetical protein
VYREIAIMVLHHTRMTEIICNEMKLIHSLGDILCELINNIKNICIWRDESVRELLVTSIMQW